MSLSSLKSLSKNTERQKKIGATSLSRRRAEKTRQPKEKSSQLVKIETVKDTPFQIRGNEKIGYTVAMGSWALTAPQKTIQRARIMIKEKTWELIGNLTMALISHNERQKALKEKEVVEENKTT